MTSAWTAKKRLAVLLVLAVWLGSSATAFWYYQLRWTEAFPGAETYALFDGTPLSDWLSRFHRPGQVTLVHLGRPDCFCNRFNDPHRQEIQAHYQPLGVHFAAPALAPDLPVSTPAVALLDTQGQLRYIGPYSDSLLCSIGDGLVEPLLDQLLAGAAPDMLHTTGVGCFCPPPNPTQE
ncbi:DUF6436 domain-containing protein [Simiduia agarivorans]|uniref:DUF6436 domain-containing protein n=1 Tax=Simiduia agarivorans (strain DSM 21679 / JCM 13881 / BCRC 17597 / SA1) TaxID=1117647 RepID=K4KJN5_SIMAS|nr:DUF6436 domain-containing protein [Simiduia agarivorans]AFU99186.1 hypothetical protein M5M_10025 [Simiduia agarivorans SA1 = DSM 21679]